MNSTKAEGIGLLMKLVLLLFLLIVSAIMLQGFFNQLINGTNNTDPNSGQGLFDEFFVPRIDIGEIRVCQDMTELRVNFDAISQEKVEVDAFIIIKSVPGGKLAQKESRATLTQGSQEISYNVTETGEKPYYLVINILNKDRKFVIQKGEYITRDIKICG
jgi:hypothetical protein